MLFYWPEKEELKGRQMTYEWVGSEAQAQTELIRQEEDQDGTITWRDDKWRNWQGEERKEEKRGGKLT